MSQKFADAARAPKLTAGIAAGDTSITVTSGGALFPVANTGTGAVGGAGDWFKAVLQNEAGFEIIYVRTHASGSNSFTNVLRGQDGTTAKAFTTDTVMGIRPVASDADATTNKRVIVTSGTGAALLPAGTTGERDAAPIAGMMRLNTTSGDFEGYIAGSWRTIGASGLISAKVEITATVGQTVFAAAYTVGLIDVYRNGALLGTADYIATNGTSVTLPGGAMTGDRLTIVSYKAAAIANAVAKSGDTMSGPLVVPAGATGSQVARANEKQDTLVSGTNIKTVNGVAILGVGNAVIAASDPDAVKLTGAQTVGGEKAFSSPVVLGAELHLYAGRKAKAFRSFSAALNSGNTNWITICNFGGSNKPMYSRFLLMNTARHYFAEITFSRTTADSLSSVAEIKLRGTYSYFPFYPAKFRIIDQGTNSSARMDMCFLGNGASTENFDIFVFEDFTAEDRSAGEYITYPFTASGAYPSAVAPNAITMIIPAGITVFAARLNTAMAYTSIINYDGSVAQTATETNVAAAG